MGFLTVGPVQVGVAGGVVAKCLHSSVFPGIQQAYIQLSVYWLTAFPLRGFLVIFEIAQLIKLLLLSVQRL
jgi:hypothetical protein